MRRLGIGLEDRVRVLHEITVTDYHLSTTYCLLLATCTYYNVVLTICYLDLVVLSDTTYRHCAAIDKRVPPSVRLQICRDRCRCGVG